MSFGLYKNYMTNYTGKNLTSIEALIGGMFAGGISVLLNNPIDVVKTRMQGLEANKYKSIKDCIIK